MRLSDITRALNEGLVVIRNRVGDRDPAKAEERKKLLDTYLGIVKIGSTRIGIRPVTHIQSGAVRILWSVNVVRPMQPCGYMAVDVQYMDVNEIRAIVEVRQAVDNMVEKDLDVDKVFADLGFIQYSRS